MTGQSPILRMILGSLILGTRHWTCLMDFDGSEPFGEVEALQFYGLSISYIIIPTYPSNPPIQQRVSTQLKNLWISRLGSSYQLPMKHSQTHLKPESSRCAPNHTASHLGNTGNSGRKLLNILQAHKNVIAHALILWFMTANTWQNTSSLYGLVSKTPHFSSNDNWVLPSQQTASWAYLSTATKSV